MVQVQLSTHFVPKLKNEISSKQFITLPVKYDYPVNLKAYLKERGQVIVDQIALKSRYLEKGDSNNFDASVKKYLDIIKEIQPTLAFIPAFNSEKQTLDQNISTTQQIHSWFLEKYDFNNLAGIILGDNEDEWIKWIKMCWGKHSWGILTNNNLKAIQLLLNEAKELKHVHLFENNWLMHQNELKRLQNLPIGTITFDGFVFDLLKSTNQTLMLEESELIMKPGDIELENFLKVVDRFFEKQ